MLVRFISNGVLSDIALACFGRHTEEKNREQNTTPRSDCVPLICHDSFIGVPLCVFLIECFVPLVNKKTIGKNTTDALFSRSCGILFFSLSSCFLSSLSTLRKIEIVLCLQVSYIVIKTLVNMIKVELNLQSIKVVKTFP